MRALWLTVALTVALTFGVSAAEGHAPTVRNTAGTVIGWTHADNRDNPAIGVIACLQNQHGVQRCIQHGNTVWKFRSRFPQVVVVTNPIGWNSTGSLRTVGPPGQEWWWSRATCAGGGEGIALYDNRPFVPGSGPSNFNNFVCLGPNETTLAGAFDGDVRFPERLPIETVVTTPPADFVR